MDFRDGVIACDDLGKVKLKALERIIGTSVQADPKLGLKLYRFFLEAIIVPIKMAIFKWTIPVLQDTDIVLHKVFEAYLFCDGNKMP